MSLESIPIVAVHGVATSPAVWDPLKVLLPQVRALRRPKTGRLSDEVEWLAEFAEGAVVVGMSGGATLGLAVAGLGVKAHGFVLHEPAAGDLVPELLVPAVEAFLRGGTAEVGRTLYGPMWSPEYVDDEGDVDAITEAELSMFRGFQPDPWPADGARCIVTTGSRSSAARRRVATALHRIGYETRSIAGASHFIAVQQPVRLAALIRQVIADPRPRTATASGRGLGATESEVWPARFWW